MAVSLELAAQITPTTQPLQTFDDAANFLRRGGHGAKHQVARLRPPARPAPVYT